MQPARIGGPQIVGYFEPGDELPDWLIFQEPRSDIPDGAMPKRGKITCVERSVLVVWGDVYILAQGTYGAEAVVKIENMSHCCVAAAGLPVLLARSVAMIGGDETPPVEIESDD